MRVAGRNSIVTIGLAAFAVHGAAVSAQPITVGQGRRPDRAAARTSWGSATGHVYDAATQAPIAGARVSVWADGRFADAGKTTAATDSLGSYSVQALLGRVSQNFDIGRALNSGLVGLLAGGATNRTKRIDILELPLMVAADGYRPYRGWCPCRTLDAVRFSVTMEPVLLVRESASEMSCAAPGWGTVSIGGSDALPRIAMPGQEVVLRAVVRMPITEPLPKVEVSAESAIWGARRLSVTDAHDPSGVVFEARVKAPRRKDTVSGLVRFRVGRSQLDIRQGGETAAVFVQVVPSTADEPRARVRDEAHRAGEAGDILTAVARWREVCSAAGAGEADYVALARAAGAVHLDEEAAEALYRAVALAKEADRQPLMAMHVAALARAGRAAQAVASYGPMFTGGAQTKDRARRSPELMAALGGCYRATGDLSAAARMRDAINEWRGPLPNGAARFRADLRLAETRAAAAREPASARCAADLGRALLDLSRWEEALPHLRRALELAPDASAVARDIEYATSRLRDESAPGAEDLTEAIAEARAEVYIGDGDRRQLSKDYHAWQRLALLLYARSEVERARGEAAYRLAIEDCMEALEQGIKCARSGARVNEGIFAGYLGYASPRMVSIAGYAYPEAAAACRMLEGLRSLQRDAADPYALIGVASALVALDQIAPASAALERARAAWDGDPDFIFLEAQVASRRGNEADALRLLGEVLRLNPRHPRAHLTLAELMAGSGDVSGAASELAAHAAVYGSAADAEGALGESR